MTTDTRVPAEHACPLPDPFAYRRGDCWPCRDCLAWWRLERPLCGRWTGAAGRWVPGTRADR